MEKTSHWAALYFVALMTFGNYVLFNLLVAILVEGFSAEVSIPTLWELLWVKERHICIFFQLRSCFFEAAAYKRSLSCLLLTSYYLPKILKRKKIFLWFSIIVLDKLWGMDVGKTGSLFNLFNHFYFMNTKIQSAAPYKDNN